MKDISKITVKYFLNKNLNSGSKKKYQFEGIIENNSKDFPLYIKITFKRKSTEIKSLLNKNFKTIEDAFKSDNEFLNAEIKLIESIITEGYKIYNDSYNLRRIADVCKSYDTITISDLLQNYLDREFENALNILNYKFKGIFLLQLPSVPIMEYYNIALKYFDNSPVILALYPTFELLSKVRNIRISKDIEFSNYKFLEWQYGNIKELFQSIAPKYKISKIEINLINNIIENEFLQLKN